MPGTRLFDTGLSVSAMLFTRDISSSAGPAKGARRLSKNGMQPFPSSFIFYFLEKSVHKLQEFLHREFKKPKVYSTPE